MTKKLLLSLFLLLAFVKSHAQSDCSDAIIVCGNTNLEGLTVTGIGTQELSALNTCSSEENNSIWLKISIKKGGTLGFNLVPESSDIREDFDFFVFGPNETCGALGQAIRCSTTNPAATRQNNNYTGMNEDETDIAEGPGNNGNSFVKWLTVADGDSYFLVIDRPIGNSNFSIQWTGTATFNSSPTNNVPTGETLNIVTCDSDGTADFTTAFDLTKNTPIIIGDQTGVNVSYHKDQNDATTSANPILNATSFINSQNPQSLFARITNTSTGCFNTSEFFIQVKDYVKIPTTESVICDDAKDGNDSNGKVTFDLSKVTSEILNKEGTTDYILKYFISRNDAETDSNELGQFFYNTIPNQQSIYVKAFSSATLCEDISEIKLTVTPLPIVNNVTIVQCDEDSDGFSAFNLTVKNYEITTTASPKITYFTSLIGAETADVEKLIPDPIAFTNTTAGRMKVWARVENTNSCIKIAQLDLIVSTTQVPPSFTRILSTCDDLTAINDDRDGIATFDFSSISKDIIAILPPATTPYSIQYFKNEADALSENNAILNPLNYRNEGYPNEQIISVRVESTADNSCYGLSPLLKLVVNPKPMIKNDLEGNKMVCSNLPAFFVTLESGIPSGIDSSNYTYKWTKDNIRLSEQTNATLDVNREGDYTVVVTSLAGCSTTKKIKVSASDIATITKIDIVDLNAINTVTVNTIGPGAYEFSLDKPNGPFQFSNFFNNVSSGIHEVYINDKNGCGTVSKTISVIGIPKYFTPNNDGFNDFWNIEGINATFNGNSTIYIFNRYGKLIKQLIPTSQGWDGTFMGQSLPSDDYWYTVKLEDGREVKGHFSLKR
ncbi:T9SS type B sorting domain-containing protein [Flavobacterium sandaracinum]|uniref:T9SS type B sorting domain-containing protein n=1 Tax=Flavobacterium sandaracinum TaxID=2541733 RepID=A0A4R5D2U2_9FLAO|nr:T9SS type B sorting domain-containing protein [Flavobacterium sandaracinum]TDE07639.1 T9SS type B sorting domain-containing protein [Flavobacterium sandaracinum]